MGLDGVEMIMAVETEFNLEIPDEDAAEMLRVGDLYEYVLRRLVSPTPSDAVWRTIRKIVAEQLGVNLEDVTLEAEFVADLGLS